MSLAVS